MGKDRTQTAKTAASTATTNAGDYGTGASNISGPLVPQLQKQATNPTGYSPTQQNSMLVAGEQGAGGANAGIVGQAGLTGARTHNTGALSGVLDSAARSKQQTLSQNALGVQNKQADLQQRQMSDAQKGLEGLYGTNVNAQLGNERLVPEDLQAEAPNNFQDVMSGLNTAGGLISAFKRPGGGGQGG